MSYNALISTKPYESYSKDQMENIKLLSTTKHGNLAVPYGSATYRIQKYPGDLDLHEVFKGNESVDGVIKKFEKVLKKIVKDISQHKIHYFSEMKVGLDNRYDVDLGEIHNGIFNINYVGVSK